MPQPDPYANQAQRNAIVEALLAQALGGSAGGDPGSASFPEEQYPVDPADPADYSAAPAVENAGFASNVTGHLADALSNPEGTLGAVLGNPAAGMPAPSMNAPTMGDLTQAAVPGDFGPAPAQTGLPAGFFDTGFNQPGETITGAPAQTAQAAPAAQAAQPGFGFGLTTPGYTPASGFIAASQFAPGPPTGYFSTHATVPGDPADTGYGSPAAFDAADQAMSSLNDAVAAQMSDALAGYSVTGTPTGAPATTGNVATDVGVGIGLGVSGGFGGISGGWGGGATGDGTSGGMGADVGGPGVGGSSTGISGGPGGTGEGGANTGEGGTGVSGGFGGGEGGGGAGGGAGK